MSGTDIALSREVRKLKELKQKLTEGLDRVHKNGSKLLQTTRKKHDDVQKSVQSLEFRMSKSMSHFDELKRASTTITQQRADIDSQIRTLNHNIDTVSSQTRNSQDSLKTLLSKLRNSQNEYQMLVNRQNRLLKYRQSMMGIETT